MTGTTISETAEIRRMPPKMIEAVRPTSTAPIRMRNHRAPGAATSMPKEPPRASTIELDCTELNTKP